MKILPRILFFVLSISLPFLSYGQTIIPVRAKKSTNSYFDKMPLPPGFRAGLHPLVKRRFLKKEKADRFNYHIDTAVVYSNYVNPRRHIYIYDSVGNKIVEKVEQQENEKWQNISKDSIVYDSVGNQILVLSKVWNNNLWENASRTIAYYISNHNMQSKINEVWKDDHWVRADSAYFLYGVNGNRVTAYHAQWIDSTASWMNKTFQIFSYDSLNNLKLELFETWKDTVWRDVQQVLYDYDSANNLIQGVIQYYGDTNWVDYYKEIYHYDLRGNRSLYVGEFWRDSLWVFDQYYSYYYNNFRELEVAIGLNWADSVWVNFEKGQYTYDNYGGVEAYLYQQWKNDSVWRNISLSQYNYDTVGNAYLGNFYSWDTISNTWQQNQDGLLHIFYGYGTADTYYTGYQVKVTYNKPITTGINTKQDKLVTQFDCMPNPAINKTTITILLKSKERISLNLYSLTGRKVVAIYQGVLNRGIHGFSVNVTRLPAGLYFASIVTKKQIKTIKLVVRK